MGVAQCFEADTAGRAAARCGCPRGTLCDQIRVQTFVQRALRIRAASYHTLPVLSKGRIPPPRAVSCLDRQAAGFQLVNLIITIGMWLVLGLSPFLHLGQAETDPDVAGAFVWVALASMISTVSHSVLTGLYGLWGAVSTWQGKDFRYRFIGTLLEKSGLWKGESLAQQE